MVMSEPPTLKLLRKYSRAGGEPRRAEGVRVKAKGSRGFWKRTKIVRRER